jgi:hypothetical protein
VSTNNQDICVLASCHGPINWLMQQVHASEQQERFVVSRTIAVVAGPVFAALSISYQLFAATAKAPVVLLNYTIFLIPIKSDGKWMTAGAYLLPKGFDLSEMFKHVFKIALLSIDIIICPIIGIISPRATVALHDACGLMELPSKQEEAVETRRPAHRSAHGALSEALDQESALIHTVETTQTEEDDQPSDPLREHLENSLITHRENFVDGDEESWDEESADEATHLTERAILPPQHTPSSRSLRQIVNSHSSYRLNLPSATMGIVPGIQVSARAEDLNTNQPATPDRLLDAIRRYDSSQLRRVQPRSVRREAEVQLSESVLTMLENSSRMAAADTEGSGETFETQ